MDKYEYNLKLDQMKSLCAEEHYAAAAEIADTINWNKIKNVNALVTAGEVYERLERYSDSRDVLLMAYDRSPIGRTIIFRLAEIAIKMKDFDSAAEYYNEFVEIAPHDNLRYVLQYDMKKAQGADYTELIAILEELKDVEYTEEWAYELAYLYHKASMSDKCVDACDELILWFGDGPYVERALELKMIYQPLTKAQEEKYRRFRLEKQGITSISAEEMERAGEYVHEPVEIPEVELDVNTKFNTVNLQREIAKGMQQIINATEKTTVSDTIDNIKKIVEDIPFLQLTPEEQKEAAEAPHIETDAEIDGSLKINFQELLGEDADGQISLMTSDQAMVERQITGQMTIGDVLGEWEKTREAAEKALQEADQKKLESAKARALHEAEGIMERLNDAIPKLDAGATPADILRQKYMENVTPETIEALRMKRETTQQIPEPDEPDEPDEPEIGERPEQREDFGESFVDPDEIPAVSTAEIDAPEPPGIQIESVREAQMQEKAQQTKDDENHIRSAVNIGIEEEPGQFASSIVAELEAELADEDKKRAEQKEAEQEVRQRTEEYLEEARERAQKQLEEVRQRAQKQREEARQRVEAQQERAEEQNQTAVQESLEEQNQTAVQESLEEQNQTAVQESLEEQNQTAVQESLEEQNQTVGQKELPLPEIAPIEPELPPIAFPDVSPTLQTKTNRFDEYVPEENLERKVTKVSIGPAAAKAKLTADANAAKLRLEAEAAAARASMQLLGSAGEEEPPLESDEAIKDPAEQKQVEMDSEKGSEGSRQRPHKEEPGERTANLAEEIKTMFRPDTQEELPETGAEAVPDLGGKARREKQKTKPIPTAKELKQAVKRKQKQENSLLDTIVPKEMLEYYDESNQKQEERHLTEEQKAVFSYFVPVAGMENQLSKALETVGEHLRRQEAAYTGNLIIQGGQGCGKTVLATSMIRALQKETGRPNNKIGKIDAATLNKKDIQMLFKKVQGGCLIVEEAGGISRQSAVTMSLLMDQEKSGLLVILEDTSKGIKHALSQDEGFARKFTETITVPTFTNDDLVAFAKSYSEELGYIIDDMAVLALYKRIGNIQRLDQATTLTEVKEIVDEAIDREARGGLHKYFTILTAKRYSDDGHIILQEKNFE